MSWTNAGYTPTTKRCAETRAHNAHEWYDPLRLHCPGGPDEGTELTDLRAKVARVEALADKWDPPAQRHLYGKVRLLTNDGPRVYDSTLKVVNHSTDYGEALRRALDGAR